MQKTLERGINAPQKKERERDGFFTIMVAYPVEGIWRSFVHIDSA